MTAQEAKDLAFKNGNANQIASIMVQIEQSARQGNTSLLYHFPISGVVQSELLKLGYQTEYYTRSVTRITWDVNLPDVDLFFEEKPSKWQRFLAWLKS